ncbi:MULTISPECIES: GAF domain-containing protein [unclassified Streptomyces]|uniref:GAF domain-containing protein n=1 Tax=unclassified Streptomyces TaxID=2593676 RepID=UPI002E180578|nr:MULTISPECIES: GAF domain-containing protein [unclassified Streptomyces]
MLEDGPSVVHDVSLAAAVGRRALPIRLCTAFTRSLGAQHATMSLFPCLEQWQLLYASDEGALRAEAAQFAHADGPSVSAALEARTVFVPEVRGADDRSHAPDWSDDLPGVRHVLALALHREFRPVGVICLYFTRPTQLPAAHITEAERAADVAREELLRWRPAHADPAGPQPVWATDTRAARWERIHRAAGYVAEREDCPVGDALAWLQTASTRRKQSLLDTCDLVLQPAGARPGGQRRAPAVAS